MTQIHSRPLLLRSSMSAKINPLGVDNGGRRHCAHVSSVFLYLYSQKFSLSPPPSSPQSWPLKETRRTCGFTTTGKYPFCPPGGRVGLSFSTLFHLLSGLFRFLFQISRSGIGGKEKPFDLFPLNTARRQLDTQPFCYTQLSAHPSWPSVLRKGANPAAE